MPEATADCRGAAHAPRRRHLVGEYWGFVHVGRAHLARDRQEKPYAVVDTEKRAGSEELVKVWTKGGSHYLTVDESRQLNSDR